MAGAGGAVTLTGRRAAIPNAPASAYGAVLALGACCAAAAAPQSQIHLIVPSPLYPVRRAASIECDTPPYTH